MNKYNLYDKEGNFVNSIVSDEIFIEIYCKENEFTYELEQSEDLEPGESPVNPIELLQEENRQLKAKITVLEEQTMILEECIVEMAGVVYA